MEIPFFYDKLHHKKTSNLAKLLTANLTTHFPNYGRRIFKLRQHVSFEFLITMSNRYLRWYNPLIIPKKWIRRLLRRKHYSKLTNDIYRYSHHSATPPCQYKLANCVWLSYNSRLFNNRLAHHRLVSLHSKHEDHTIQIQPYFFVPKVYFKSININRFYFTEVKFLYMRMQKKWENVMAWK